MQAEAIKNIMGVILVGGKSSRMGTNKALICVDGDSFLGRTLATLKQLHFDVITLIGKRSLDEPLIPDVMHLSDLYEGLGPASGIHAALHFAAERNATCENKIDGVLIVPIDMPNLTPTLLSLLAQQGQQAGTPAFYESNGEKFHFPLYMPVDMHFIARLEGLLVNASKDKAEKRNKHKGLSLKNILSSHTIKSIPTNDQQAFVNINTLEDLKRFKSLKLTVGN
jgi:molybdopterin-guanine dinucleotide biosynthesis protein A